MFDHPFQIGNLDPGVTLGGGHRSMPQKLLNLPDVGLTLQKMSGAGVAYPMRICRSGESGLFPVPPDQMVQIVGEKFSSVLADEKQG